VEDAKPYRLAEQIETLAKTIKGLISSLNGAGNELETLLANPQLISLRVPTTSITRRFGVIG
jgi:hypothetical protein